ncbi:MAG: EamA family transporter [Dysgonamonadaceae bacterium]|jgi:undecaprenyl phosphate-alpha-L-ara4N flippase subunit ArnE|nr:EamA family transporter [Dysgonamonadaceae bacterium]
MWKIVLLSIIQCLFLSGGQVFLKLAMNRIDRFRWTGAFLREQLANGWLLASGVSMIAATFLWMYILKHFDLSIAYPLTSIGYLFGMLAGVFIFHETVPVTRWIGLLLVVGGICLIVKQ